MTFLWTPEHCEILVTMAAANCTSRRIAEALGVTRNAVIGKARRMKVELRSVRKSIPKAGLKRIRRKIKLRAKSEQKAPPSPKIHVFGAPVSIFDLTSHTCRWPVSLDDRGVIALYCGEKTLTGCSYCAKHQAMAFQPYKRMIAA